MGKKTVGKIGKTSIIAEEYEHGKHPRSLKNLNPFKKGESGNPGGRLKNYANLKKALDRWSNKEVDYDCWDIPTETDAQTLKEQVIFAIWDKARRGNVKCIEILAQLGCLDDK